MKYALKGTDEEWADALKNKEVDGSTVQIRRTEVVKTPKRKAEDSTSVLESIMKSDKGASSGSKGKKSKSKKKSRKTIG